MMATSPQVRNVSSPLSALPSRQKEPPRRRFDVLARAAMVAAALVLIAVLQTLLFLGLS